MPDPNDQPASLQERLSDEIDDETLDPLDRPEDDEWQQKERFVLGKQLANQINKLRNVSASQLLALQNQEIVDPPPAAAGLGPLASFLTKTVRARSYYSTELARLSCPL